MMFQAELKDDLMKIIDKTDILDDVQKQRAREAMEFALTLDHESRPRSLAMNAVVLDAIWDLTLWLSVNDFPIDIEASERARAEKAVTGGATPVTYYNMLLDMSAEMTPAQKRREITGLQMNGYPIVGEKNKSEMEKMAAEMVDYD